jgi:predicted DCC family thiol-disulfide oxidoreductase YuxK
MGKWDKVYEGFDQWFKITCYLGGVWVLLDVLPYLPTYLVDRIFEAVLRKLGI